MVAAIGPAVTRVRPWRRVAVEPAISCGTCDQCAAGRLNTCRDIGFLGHPGEKDGCLGEFFVMPERNCSPLPAGLTPAEGVLAEPLSIALHALNLATGTAPAAALRPRHGPHRPVPDHGGAGARRLRDLRNRPVRRPGRRRPQSGQAVWASNPDRTNIVREILARRPQGLDIVFEVSGDPAAMDQAVEIAAARRADRPGRDPPRRARRPPHPEAPAQGDHGIQHVRQPDRCLEPALDLIARRRLDVAWLSTHAFPPAEAPKAFTTAADRLDGVLKASIVFQMG